MRNRYGLRKRYGRPSRRRRRRRNWPSRSSRSSRSSRLRRNIDPSLLTLLRRRNAFDPTRLTTLRRRNVFDPRRLASLRRRRNKFDPSRLASLRRRRNRFDPTRLTTLRRWNPHYEDRSQRSSRGLALRPSRTVTRRLEERRENLFRSNHSGFLSPNRVYLRKGHRSPSFRRNPDPSGKPWGPDLYNPLEDSKNKFKNDRHYHKMIAKLRRNPW